MKTFLILALLFINSYSLTLEESKHLLNRTSFGYDKKDLIKFQSFTKEEAINYLINTGKSKKTINPPSNIKDVSIFSGKFKNLSKEERKIFRKKKNKKMIEIQSWWYKMILDSSYSFRERMTLFWHNHFTSEYKVVKSPFLMYEQNMLYRNNALGNFANLLDKSSQDLAMLVYLDNNSNKKSHPNENYARELLELFTLGEGNYTEKDIKEAARAFTGLRVNKKNAKLKLVKKHHDYKEKVFLGVKGKLNAKDIIEIILKQKQTSRFIVTKLYKEFISKKINEEEIERLANNFVLSDYDISILMKDLLLSDDFWLKKNRGNMIKSPVEMIGSLIKSLDIKLNEKDYKFIQKYARNLGQNLFNPPNVKGWIGGNSWIDTSSLVTRNEFTKALLKKRLSENKIKKLDLYDFEDFKNYFYAISVDENVPFKNSKKDYMTLLSKSIYQLK